MPLIPQNTNTTEFRIESVQQPREPRRYLGMSSIGIECLRRQWYAWRWTVTRKIIARVQRIFERGHNEEASIIRDLKLIGCEVFRVDKQGNEIELIGTPDEKQEELIGFHRHSMGHPDGRLRGVIEAPKTIHLLEMKTMQDKYFTVLREKGVEEGFPEYFDQMIMYMGRMKLTRGLLIATNKNDQARKYERVKFNQDRFEILVEREESIILSEQPPKKAYKEDFWKCQWCAFHQVCHNHAEPNKNCRTCEFGNILPRGKWECGLTGKRLSTRKQIVGCKRHKRLF